MKNLKTMINGGGRFAPAVNKERLLYFGIIAIVTIIVYLGSPLNPFSVQPPTTDVQVYSYIAYGILNGQLPYVDMFDHKGTFLYLIYCIGIVLGFGSTTGIWFVAVIFALIGLYFNYKIGYLLTSSEKIAALSTLLVILSFGNFVWAIGMKETFSLPFIFASLYLFIRHIKKISSRPYLEMVIIGICGGCVLFITPTLAALWLVIGIWVIVEAIHNRNLRTPCKLFLAILVGVLMSTVPHIIYLCSIGAFNSFIECYLLYNINYSEIGVSSFSIIYQSLNLLYVNITTPVIVFSELVLLFSLVNKKFRNNGGFEICLFALLFYIICIMTICLIGHGYSYYSVLIFPCLSIPLAFGICGVHYVISKMTPKKWEQSIVLLLCVGIIGVSGFCPALTNILSVNNQKVSSLTSSGDILAEEQIIIDFIDSYTRDGDYIQIIGNVDYLYLETNTTSASRFSYDPIGYEEEMLTSLIDNSPIIIVEDIRRRTDLTKPIVMDYIHEHYISIANTENYILYLNKEVNIQ